MTDNCISAEYEAEIARLHRFVLQVANRLAGASEVLSHLAERREKRRVLPASKVAGYDAETIERLHALA